jgi:2-keto-4-pentenoate hydratase
MDAASIARAAAALAAARPPHPPIDSLPADAMPADLSEAYAIQDAFVEEILKQSGGRRIGYKAGATAPAPQELLKLDGPFYGVLLSALTSESGVNIPASACHQRVLEVEFAFRMAEDLPPAAAPYDPDGVRAAVGSALLAIEVVDFRLSGGFQAGGLQLIADNGAHGHWVTGREFADLDAVDWEDFEVSLKIDDAVVQSGNSATVMGNPLHSLTWLANTLCQAGKGLQGGDLVTTGSCTAPHPAQAGDRVTAEFGALGTVDLTFGV